MCSRRQGRVKKSLLVCGVLAVLGCWVGAVYLIQVNAAKDALYGCLMCMPHVYALYVCLICMPYMYAI